MVAMSLAAFSLPSLAVDALYRAVSGLNGVGSVEETAPTVQETSAGATDQATGALPLTGDSVAASLAAADAATASGWGPQFPVHVPSQYAGLPFKMFDRHHKDLRAGDYKAFTVRSGPART
ncbi:hypothetical protein EON67_03975 [archaeon]|nr:MAG: hypothetical protein EON67_03975 [archaeon]